MALKGILKSIRKYNFSIDYCIKFAEDKQVKGTYFHSNTLYGRNKLFFQRKIAPRNH